MLWVDRVEGGGEPTLLGDIEPWQRVQEVGLVHGSGRLRFVQQRDFGPAELDAVRITPAKIRDVQADAPIAAV